MSASVIRQEGLEPDVTTVHIGDSLANQLEGFCRALYDRCDIGHSLAAWDSHLLYVGGLCAHSFGDRHRGGSAQGHSGIASAHTRGVNRSQQ